MRFEKLRVAFLEFYQLPYFLDKRKVNISRVYNNCVAYCQVLNTFFSTDLNKPKCYGVYGCFSNDKPWTTEKRLISLYPESPLKINPRYPVFTKDTRIIPRFLDLNEPRNTRSVGINRNGNIYFVAHGYLESGDRPWVCLYSFRILSKS